MKPETDMPKFTRLMKGWRKSYVKAYCSWLRRERPRQPGDQPPGSPVSVVGYLHGYNRCRRIADELGVDVDASSDVAAIWTPAMVRAVYDHMLQNKFSPTTIRITLISLERFLCAVDPKVDRSIVARLLKFVPRHGSVRRKGERLRDSEELSDIGVELMNEALARAEFDKAAAIAYRIGLQIALLSMRPYRLSVFTSIRHLRPQERITEAGTFLKLENGCYYINHRPNQHHGPLQSYHVGTATAPIMPPHHAASGKRSRRMKGGKHTRKRLMVPNSLTKYVQIYLERVLVVLDPRRSTDRLWLSAKGTPLSKLQFYKDVCAHTRDDEADRWLCPQLMRDCYVTSLSRRSPGNDLKAHETLGNSARMSSERYELPDRTRSLKVGRQISAIMAFYHEPLPTGP